MNGPLVLLAALVGSVGVLWAYVEVDAWLDRRAERRKYPDAYRYARARDAVARAQNPHTRIGHDRSSK